MGNILAKKEAKHSNSTFGFEANIKALPLEVLEHIWSYLDFDNRQKIATQVSTKWFRGIRSSIKLSSELKIRRRLSNRKVNATLANWPKLRILQVDEQEGKVKSDILQMNIKNYENLEKIICSPNLSTIPQLGNEFDVEKIWIYPSEEASAYKLENIVQLKINKYNNGSHINTENNTISKMQEFGSKMRSLENLTVISQIENLDLEWIQSLKCLKTLKIRSWSYFKVIWIEHLKKTKGLKKLTMYDCRFDWDVFKSLMELPTDQTLILEDCWLRCNSSTLLDTVNVLGGRKNMKIQNFIRFRLENYWDKEKTRETFKQAEEILKQKFPGGIYCINKWKYGLTVRKKH